MAQPAAQRPIAHPPAVPVKPRFRGVSHKYAFYVSLVAGGLLVAFAGSSKAALALGIYAFSVSAMFGTSALYHRVDWSAAKRRWMRRLDHSMIFVLIAGTYTPFALLVLHGTLATVVLIAVWVGALAAIVFKFIWIDAPKWVQPVIGIALGWIVVIAFPQLVDELGTPGVILVALGGVLYTVGALVYTLKRPDPAPATFGYHEVFHALVIAAAAAQFAAMALYVLPG